MYCDDCPVGPGCRGTVHRRFCELQRTSTDYRDLLMRQAGLDPARPVDLAREPVRLPVDRKTTQAPRSAFSATNVATGRIRVGFLSPNLNAAGAESVQLQMLRGLESRYHLVGMVVGDPMDRTDAGMTARTMGYVPIRYGLDQIAGLANQCDVLISWMVEDMGRWLGGASTPVVYLDHFPHDGPLDAIAQYCLQGAAAVVGVSSLCSPAWTAEVWSGRHSIIPNSVDVDRLRTTRTRAEMLTEWGIPPDALVAGSYCRVHLDRRPDAVVRAIAHLPEPWHVVLVGQVTDIAELQYIHNFLSQLPPEVANRVHIRPEDTGSGDVLGAFDVVVSAASGATESFGLTMAESLWLGKPVVATPFGLAKMHPEFFYPVALDGDPTTVAGAILAAHDGGCRAGAQAVIRSTYSVANFVDAWVRLIEKVAGVGARSDAGGRIIGASTVAPPPPSLPGFPRMVGNFTRAVVRHAADRFTQVDPAIQAERIATCRACENFKSDTSQCRLCGCLCNAKAAWRSESCPEGRWAR